MAESPGFLPPHERTEGRVRDTAVQTQRRVERWSAVTYLLEFIQTLLLSPTK